MAMTYALTDVHQWSKVVDATRISDGTKVYLKKLKKDTPERAISVFLSSSERLNDPHNHCVPIIDHFDDPHDDKIEYIVIPLLREFDDQPFVFVGEVVDFVRQTLEVSTAPHLRVIFDD